jgi:putative transposase
MKLSAVFGGQFIGIREVADRIWLISFMMYVPGFFDEDENRVEPAGNPFTPKVLPMCPVRTMPTECCTTARLDG